MSDRAPELRLTLDEEGAAFAPGARVGGVAAWSAARPPRGIELRLSWVLSGKGGRDYKIAETIPLPTPAAAERRRFKLTLPAAPYSFRGALLTLSWTLELVALPGEEKTRLELVIAPGGRAIAL
ncbi:MAG TPA: hypothetical protein VKZ18_24595 [Polyangia bacterium]|nr:hypothetical protein [Polyangia bacterium]